jgi:hypothetical protein
MKGSKGHTDEGGVRSVCYVRWPAKLPAGHTVTQIAGAIDLLPTLTSLAGVKRVGDQAARRPRSFAAARPIPVGYREFPRTWLPARDAAPQGGIERSASAPNSSYFVNWKSTEGRIVWEVDIHTSGKYAVELQYTCSEADVGSTIELSHGESRLVGKVAPGWDPPLYTNQDTLPRPPAESSMKEFRPLKLGTIDLAAGRGPLVLRATEIPGHQVMHLRAVTLTLLP